MADVELVSYKIKELNVVNKIHNIPKHSLVELDNVMEFNVTYEQNDRVAVATMLECVSYQEDPDVFFIEMVMQGTYRLYCKF